MNQMEASRPGALAGLRIVELPGGALASACSQWFVVHGAEVILVDRPAAAPIVAAADAGKRRITLDCNDAEGALLLLRLLQRSDVLIETANGSAQEAAACAGGGLIHLRIAAAADPAAATAVCATVLLALHHRQRTGEGQALCVAGDGTPHLSATPGRPPGPVRPRGADNEAILSGMLGLDAAARRILRDAGIV